LVGLRKKHPNLVRPFITPFYPWMPAISFILSIFCFLAMLIGNLDQPGAFAPLTEYGSVVIEFGLFWVLAMIYYFAVVKPGKRIATTHDSN